MTKSGFVLMEAALALAIAVFCLFILTALLAVGVKANRDSRLASASALVADSIRMKLLTDADWPAPQIQSLGKNWSANFYYDANGNSTTEKQAALRAELSFLDSSGLAYASKRLDGVRLRLYETAGDRLMTEFFTQRAHSRPRP
ncbi:MAG: hypothetical protein V1746_03695 [bacterium]